MCQNRSTCAGLKPPCACSIKLIVDDDGVSKPSRQSWTTWMASWVNTSNCSPGSSRSPCDKQRRFTPMLYAARSAPGPQRSSRSMTTPSCSSRSINRSVRAEREIARAGAAQDASKATASSRRTAKSETHQTQPEPTLVRGSAIRLSAVSRVLCRPSCVSAHRNGGLLSRHLQQRWVCSGYPNW